MSRAGHLVLGLASVMLVVGCSRRESSRGATRATPLVCTTFYPTTYFASRIAGDAVEVRCPLPPGEDPATWRPARDALAMYQDADLVVVNGASFESWVNAAALPESRVVDTTASLDAPFIRLKGVVHSHGPRGQHSHAGTDGHTWLDPINATAQARAIASALSERWPQHAAAFDERSLALAQDLATLDASFRALAPRAAQSLILASHPAYNYPSRRYDLGIVTVMLDPEVMPDPKALAEISEVVGARPQAGPRLMLWEDTPLPEAAALLRERFDIVSVVFDPCESAGDTDYLARMRENIARLEGALNAAP